jgi:hypothetical protein
MSHENSLVSEALGPYSLRTNTDAERAVLLAEPEINPPDPETLPSSAEVVLKVFKQSFLPQLMAERQAKT